MNDEIHAILSVISISTEEGIEEDIQIWEEDEEGVVLDNEFFDEEAEDKNYCRKITNYRYENNDSYNTSTETNSYLTDERSLNEDLANDPSSETPSSRAIYAECFMCERQHCFKVYINKTDEENLLDAARILYKLGWRSQSNHNYFNYNHREPGFIVCAKCTDNYYE